MSLPYSTSRHAGETPYFASLDGQGMSVLDAVRRPEYTGENRCWPCTAVNLFLVGAAAAVAAALRRRTAAVGVALVGAAAVALRGYVVPYTPAYAPRVVAALPVSSSPGPKAGAGSGSGPESPRDADASPERSDEFGDVAPADAVDAEDADTAGRRVVDALFAAGALRESDGELSLADDVRAARAAEMDRLRDADDDALAAAVADAAPFPATARTEYDGVTVEAAGESETETGADRSAWLTRALAIADAASVRALRDTGVDAATAARAATPLRTLLETCPLCGGRVVETTYIECCGGSGSIYETPGTPVLACDDCGEVVHRLDG